MDGVLVIDKAPGPTSHDVVRHRLVGHIVAAYDVYEARREQEAVERGNGDTGRRPRRA